MKKFTKELALGTALLTVASALCLKVLKVIDQKLEKEKKKDETKKAKKEALLKKCASGKIKVDTHKKWVSTLSYLLK